jgi:putative transposase
MSCAGRSKCARTRTQKKKIVAIPKEVENGSTVLEVSRKHNLRPQTIYRWKEKYGGMQGSDVRKLKSLEDENARVKRMVANMALENEDMKDLIQKKF